MLTWLATLCGCRKLNKCGWVLPQKKKIVQTLLQTCDIWCTTCQTCDIWRTDAMAHAKPVTSDAQTPWHMPNLWHLTHHMPNLWHLTHRRHGTCQTCDIWRTDAMAHAKPVTSDAPHAKPVTSDAQTPWHMPNLWHKPVTLSRCVLYFR